MSVSVDSGKRREQEGVPRKGDGEPFFFFKQARLNVNVKLSASGQRTLCLAHKLSGSGDKRHVCVSVKIVEGSPFQVWVPGHGSGGRGVSERKTPGLSGGEYQIPPGCGSAF